MPSNIFSPPAFSVQGHLLAGTLHASTGILHTLAQEYTQLLELQVISGTTGLGLKATQRR